MKLFRCKVCGDPYIGEAKPTHCPFCGADKKYIVSADDYETPIINNLSEKSRNNLLAALTLELINADFYWNNYQNAKTDYNKQMFKALSKIEAEHASAVKKALKFVDSPSYNKSSAVFESDEEIYKEAHKREIRARAFYKKSADEAVEPRIKELFTALSEIENDHIIISESRG
jgi:rubrerythrin